MPNPLHAYLSVLAQLGAPAGVASPPSGLETAALISIIVVGVFFLLLIPLLLLLLLQLRKLNGTVRQLGERGLDRASPLIESGKAVADNLEFVSLAVRTDVERLTGSVKSISERLQQASDRMEERVGEFNALMEVVQAEAEDLFVGAASTVRGVRQGARALAAGARSSPHEEDELEAELPPADPSVPSVPDRYAQPLGGS